MSPVSIPLHARSQLNRGYAASLRHVAEVIAAAPPSQAPNVADFTPVLSGEGRKRPVGHVILTWLPSERALRLEFDADGLIDTGVTPMRDRCRSRSMATYTGRPSPDSRVSNDLDRGSRSVLPAIWPPLPGDFSAPASGRLTGPPGRVPGRTGKQFLTRPR